MYIKKKKNTINGTENLKALLSFFLLKTQTIRTNQKWKKLEISETLLGAMVHTSKFNLREHHKDILGFPRFLFGNSVVFYKSKEEKRLKKFPF